jgi:hypothetical protein
MDVADLPQSIPQTSAFSPSRRRSPFVLFRTRYGQPPHAGVAAGGGRSSAMSRSNVLEQFPRDRDLSHLEDDVAAMALNALLWGPYNPEI